MNGCDARADGVGRRTGIDEADGVVELGGVGEGGVGEGFVGRDGG